MSRVPLMRWMRFSSPCARIVSTLCLAGLALALFLALLATARADPPVAIDDRFDAQVDEDSVGVVLDVLANDQDADGDTLTIVDRTHGAYGTVAIVASGAFVTYTPQPDYAGWDSFTYTASDGGGTSTATVDVYVKPSNDPPVLNSLPDQSLDEDTRLDRAIDLWAYASDIETGDAGLAYTIDNTPDPNARVAIESGRYIAIRPVENWYGATDVRIKVSDPEGASVSQTFVVTVTSVNDPPQATDDEGSIDEDRTLNVYSPSLLANDVDPDGDVLSVQEHDPVSAQGALVVVNAQGSYSYDPTDADALQALARNETVIDTFAYTATDGLLTDMATVRITVSGRNDGPAAGDDQGRIPEDAVLVVSAPGVLDNDTDPDLSDSLVVASHDATSTLGATVVVNPGGSYRYDPTAAPTLQALRRGDSVADGFAYTVDDGHGGTDSARVRITVDGRNDYPVADAGPDQSVDTLTRVTLDGSGSYDPDEGDTLRYTWTQFEGERVTLQPDARIPTFDAPIDPDVLVFELHVEDDWYWGAADMVTITVNNQAPVADAVARPEAARAGQRVTLDGSGSHDPDGDELTFGWSQIFGIPVTLLDPSAPSTTFDAPNEPSTLRFALTVTDTYDDSNSTTVRVPVDNRPPLSDAGEDLVTDTLTLVTLDGSGSHDEDGHLPLTYTWQYTGELPIELSDPTVPTPTFTTPSTPTVLSFALFVIDALGLPAENNPDRVTITVTNRPPVADAGPDRKVVLNTLVTLDGTGSVDPDHDLPLTYRWRQTGGESVTLSDPLSATPAFTTPHTPTVLTFSLAVTDALGLPDRTPDEVVLNVDYASVYLPDIMREHVMAPDLVVQDIRVTTNGVQVTIGNQGYTSATNAFYVALYIDPDDPNHRPRFGEYWWDLGPYGIAWEVLSPIVPLAPGDSHRLYLEKRHGEYVGNHRPDLTNVNDAEWPPAPGTVLYAQVDYYPKESLHGGVIETHEVSGGPYNNVLGPVRVSISTGTEVATPTPTRECGSFASLVSRRSHNSHMGVASVCTSRINLPRQQPRTSGILWPHVAP